MTLRLHYLQRVSFEGPGQIGPWAETAGVDITATRFFQDPALPVLETFDFLVILGGPMSTHVTHRYPWLDVEKQFIRDAVAAGKAVLGICLGAQLIAEALGARVYPNDHREIGWFDIERPQTAVGHAIGACLPPRIKVFHWHGDTFDLPEGALQIARSAVCRNQGFVAGDRVVGLQFHLETTPESLQALITNGSDDLKPGPYVQSIDSMRSENECYGPNRDALNKILEQLAASPGIS